MVTLTNGILNEKSRTMTVSYALPVCTSGEVFLFRYRTNNVGQNTRIFSKTASVLKSIRNSYPPSGQR